MDFSPLCRGRLSTIFRRFTSLLGVGTRLTRIDKTSCSSSPVFSILAGRDSTSRVADKRCHWCKNQVEMGTFLQTNKQTRYRYIHSCQGKFPSFLSKAPVQGGTNHSHWIWLWWRKRCPEKNCWKYCSRLLRYALAMMRSLWMWLWLKIFSFAFNHFVDFFLMKEWLKEFWVRLLKMSA